MSWAFVKRLFEPVSEVVAFQIGSLRLFSTAIWCLALGEEERTVVDGKSGLNVFDGCVSEVETVIDGLWVLFTGCLLSMSVSRRLSLSTSPTPTILSSLFVKSSYEGPARPLVCG